VPTASPPRRARPSPLPAALLLTAFLLTPALRAQRRHVERPRQGTPAHRLINIGSLEDAEGLLSTRLRHARDLHEVEKLLKNPELLRTLLDGLTDDDRRALQDLQRLIVNGEDVRGDTRLKKLAESFKRPEIRDRLSKDQIDLVERWSKAPPPVDRRPTPPGWPPGRPPGRPPEMPATPPPGHEVMPPSAPFRPTRKPSSPIDRFKEKSSTWVKDRLDRWVDSFEDPNSLPGGDRLRGFYRWMGTTRPEEFGLPSATRAQGWFQDLGAHRWLARTRGLRKPFDESSIPGWMRPSDPPQLGSLPDVPSGGDALGPLVWVLVLAALALALYGSFSLYRERIQEALVRRWKLGPWPVQPSAVRSREDLVRAFEYLAFLLLGFEVRSRHHLDVAGRLASRPSTDPSRQHQAAHELAQLYEQARYAPGEEPLGEAELAAARRDLCFLAGHRAA
jgi:hypothetical protein